MAPTPLMRNEVKKSQPSASAANPTAVLTTNIPRKMLSFILG